MYEKGLKLIDNGNLNEALHCLEEALLKDPKDTVIWGKRGIILYHLKRYESAISSFNRALVENSKDIVLWRLKGFTLEKTGRIEAAEKCFDKVKELQIEEIAKEHSTETNNIHRCVRCGKIYIREERTDRFCQKCDQIVYKGKNLPNPIGVKYYSIDKILDTDHYE